MNILDRLYEMTALQSFVDSPGTLLMLGIGFFVLYLGIKKAYEPLLLVPIGFGIILANALGGGMSVVTNGEIEHLTIIEIAKDYGIMNMLYYSLIKTGLLPPIIFMGVGAMTDFGPMLRNLRLTFFGGAAQIGIFSVLMAALYLGFSPKEAASLGIIGGADGPTAIYTTIILAPHLLGPIAIAAYSYMALVPVIIPFVVRLTTNSTELKINMKEQDKLYPKKHKIKNIKRAKIIFPIIVGAIVSLAVPSSVPLVGMLLFGNLIKEVGSLTERLHKAAAGGIMNTATIFLGLLVGATMTVDSFLNYKTLMIIAGGFIAFSFPLLEGFMQPKFIICFLRKRLTH